ncbi:uncharacterized protein LOC126881266 isoform X1 [Diabrotica virgifera virgifera]|uniref:Uncharacterized protein n=1 Tax=Diabrotica virgifera virgifera TaxID=50390 RepID=A0ABM5JTY8_DIAVI|nr:uncharacterized protein LOC126881266 isoform X1 [Diabrotica virgifera virgifera]
MIAKTLCFLLVLFYGHQVNSRTTQGDVVEWQDYNPDSIPDDAIPSGGTLDGQDIYIGLVHFNNKEFEGFIPTNIIGGQKCVHIPVGLEEIETVCDDIKILVGKNDYLNKLYWEIAKPSFFESYFDSDDFRPVRAGWESHTTSYNSSLYIGKQYFSGVNWIGKIYNSYPKTDENGAAVYVFENYFDPEELKIYKGVYYGLLLFRY